MTQSSFSSAFFGLLAVLWLGSGLVGMVVIAGKGYLADLSFGLGCLLAVFFGWWAVPIALVAGPLWLGGGLMLESRTRCPFCKRMNVASATKCGHCGSDISPAALARHVLPPPTPALAPAFAALEQRWYELLEQRSVGTLSAAEFEAAYQQLQVRDEQGRLWSKGRESGAWAYFDGERWISNTPPKHTPQPLNSPPSTS